MTDALVASRGRGTTGELDAERFPASLSCIPGCRCGDIF
jgi:hypothetical protein